MIRILSIIPFIFLLLTGFVSHSQIDLDQLEEDVYTLAADDMKGRETGTAGEKKASRYIAKRFRAIGLQPPPGQKDYLQKFETIEMANPHKQDSGRKVIQGRNVLGWYDAGMERTLVIGAHYDHLGMGASGSLHAGEPAVHNGADDNASGVAALFALADRVLRDELPVNVLFIAFSGEEKGLLGSKYFVDHSVVPLDQIDCMFNMDMIGRLDPDRGLALYGTGTSPNWKEEIPDCVPRDIPLKKESGGIGPSDHTSFYLENIPVLHFFTGQHEDYHKPGDDADKLNYKGMTEVIDILYCFLKDVAHEKDIAFTTTKSESRSRRSPHFSVTLGVMPDYLFDGEGMRIDAVRGGGPAEAAGLQDGDVVIQLGPVEVNGMQTYMKALSRFEKGDKTKVTVRRNGEEYNYDIQF